MLTPTEMTIVVAQCWDWGFDLRCWSTWCTELGDGLLHNVDVSGKHSRFGLGNGNHCWCGGASVVKSEGKGHSTVQYKPRWWASSSDTLIYPSIFAFPSLSLHCWSTTMHLHSNATTRQLHSPHQTNLTYLMDTWLMIHMYLLLFLVSPTCPLLRSNQSWALTLHGQALSITSPYAHILIYHSYLTCLYLPFNHHHQSPNQLPIWVSPRIEI